MLHSSLFAFLVVQCALLNNGLFLTERESEQIGQLPKRNSEKPYLDYA